MIELLAGDPRWAQEHTMRSRLAVFLDRDGTINVDRPDYVRSWREFAFLPRALDGLRVLAKLDLNVIVVTNQSAIDRDIISRQDAEEINRRMMETVERSGGRITAVYICPHTPWDSCSCRKPRPGLLLQAAYRHSIDLASSFMVGDRDSDIEVGVLAGCYEVILVSSSVSELSGVGKETRKPMIRVPDLYEASVYIGDALREAPRAV